MRGKKLLWLATLVLSLGRAPGAVNEGLIFVCTPNNDAYRVVCAGSGKEPMRYEKNVWPILFEHPSGNLLVGTTKLSQFVTGRYGPLDGCDEILIHSHP